MKLTASHPMYECFPNRLIKEFEGQKLIIDYASNMVCLRIEGRTEEWLFRMCRCGRLEGSSCNPSLISLRLVDKVYDELDAVGHISVLKFHCCPYR